MEALVAVAARHHVAGPTLASTDTTMHSFPPVKPLWVKVMIQNWERVTCNIFQLLLSILASSLPSSTAAPDSSTSTTRSLAAWRTPLGGTSHHSRQPVPLLVTLLGNGKIAHCHRHHPSDRGRSAVAWLLRQSPAPPPPNVGGATARWGPSQI